MSPRTRLLPIALTLVGVALVAGVAVAEPDGPRPYAPALKSLERVAHQLAAGHKDLELADLLDTLAQLGHPEKALERLKDRCGKERAAAVEPKWNAKQTTGRLRRAVRGITKTLGELPDDERVQVATLALRLDDTVDEAHTALGHSKVDGVWLAPDQVAGAKRAAAVRKAVADAKELAIELETKPSGYEFLEAVAGRPGIRVSARGWIFHSATVGPERLARTLTGILRALALSNWFATGELAVPEARVPFQGIVCGAHDEYFKAIELSLEGRGIDGDTARIAREVANYEDSRGFTVINEDSITRQQSDALVTMWSEWTWHRKRRHVQPVLAVGHLNWLSLECIGRPISGFVWMEPSGETAAEGGDAEYRKQLFKSARESIPNARRYLQYLEQRGQGPAFARAARDRMSGIRGDPFVKATLVAAYLQERGTFFEIVDATTREPRGPAAFEKAFGTDLARFEETWRMWLLPMPIGLAGRLE